MEITTLANGLTGFGHPVRIACLVLLENERSPSDLFGALQQIDTPPTLGTVAYHVRMLKQYDLVYETHTAPRRGALEHFYRRTDTADALLKVLAPVLGLPRRGPGRPGRNGKRVTELLAAIGLIAEVEEPEAVAA